MDPYKVLGLSHDATDEEIKKAYRTLTKKYHPDLNPNDPNSEKKYAEINNAYDMIQKGKTNPGYGSYNSSNDYSEYTYSSPFSGWQQQYWQQQANHTDNERSECTAARNYIRNGMSQEALNALSGVPVSERDGKWYYLHSVANMYLGNKIAALESAKRACEIEPDNEEYRRLLEQLQNGGNYYNNYTVKYSSGLDTSKICLTLCAVNACLGFPCGHFICC